MTIHSKYSIVCDEMVSWKNQFQQVLGSNTSRLHKNSDLPLFQKMHDHLILLHKTNELHYHPQMVMSLSPKYFVSFLMEYRLFELVEQEPLMVGRKERLVN